MRIADAIMSFGSLQIVANVHMPENQYVQVRFPRSKKRRIRKKWAKNMRYFVEKPVAWMIGGIIYVHPHVYEKFQTQLTVVQPQEVR